MPVLSWAGLGVLLGQGAVRLVTQTINDLYYVVTVTGVSVPVFSLAKGFALGMLATIVSAALPAWEAASVPPRLALSRSAVEDRARRMVPLTAWGGALSLLAGVGVLAFPTRNLVVSFAGIFFLTIGFALLAPAVTLLVLRGAGPATRRAFGVPGRLAPRSAQTTLSRTAVAIAALMVAVSVTIGVGLMVDSFRSTVVVWLGQTLYSDIYVNSAVWTSTRPSAPLDPAIVEIASTWPGVQDVQKLRGKEACNRPAAQSRCQPSKPATSSGRRSFVASEGSNAAVSAAVRNGAILVSEPLAERLNLPHHGGSLTLNTDRGPQAFPIAGIYRDYSSSQGIAMMDAAVYRSYWMTATGRRSR